MQLCPSFFFNDTATTEIYTLSLHDALPIFTLFVTTYVAERQQQAAGGAAAAEGSEAKPISELEISGAEKQQFQKLGDKGVVEAETVNTAGEANQPNPDKYAFSVLALVITAGIIVAYMAFVYSVSFKEYREVIREKFEIGRASCRERV